MAEYSNIIGRAEVSDAMLPPEISKEIIQEAPKSSVILSRARRVALTKKEGKQPILSSMPSAYWINGDTGLVQTDEVNWGTRPSRLRTSASSSPSRSTFSTIPTFLSGTR